MLTHTSPCPPPAAGVAATTAAVAGAAEGDALTELVGLKKSARVFFDGDGDGVTAGEMAAVVLPLRTCFSAGEGDVTASGAGEGEVAEVVFALRMRLATTGEGDAAASAAGEGEVAEVAFAFRARFPAGERDASGAAADDALLAGDASAAAAAFLRGCLARDGEGVGD